MSLAKKSLSTFIARVITFLVSVTASIVIARILGPEGKGMWAALIFVPSITFTLLNLGISSANVYFAGSRKYGINQIINNSFHVTFAVLLIIFFVYFFGFEKVYHFLADKYPGFTPRHLYLVLFALPFVFIFNYMNGVLQGKERIYAANIISVISQFLTILSILIALLVFKLYLLGLVYVYLGVRIINTIIILFVINRETPIKPDFNLNPELLKGSLKYGVKSYLANSFQMLNYRADVFLIFAFLGPESLGFYTVGIAAAEVVWFISHSVAFPLFPRIASLGREASKSLVPRAARIIFLSSFLVAILLAGVARWLIPFFYGAKFIPSIIIIYIILPGILLFSPARAISSYFSGIGKPHLNTFVSFVTLIVNIGLNLTLIPRMGINGAALASAISYTLTYLIYLPIYHYETGISPIKFFLFKGSDLQRIQESIIGIFRKDKLIR